MIEHVRRGRSTRSLAALLSATLLAGGGLAGCGLSGSLSPSTQRDSAIVGSTVTGSFTGQTGSGPTATATTAPSTTGVTGPVGTSGSTGATGTTGSTSPPGALSTPTTTPTATSTTPPGAPTVPTATTGGCGSLTTTTGGASLLCPTPTTTTVLPGTGLPTIAIGDQNTPEQFVLGELYRIALDDYGYSTTLAQNIGTPTTPVQALEQGTLDLYPAYINQWDTSVAGIGRGFRSLRAAYGAGQHYAAQHHLELLAPTRFYNTDAIAVPTTFARAHRLRSLVDLAAMVDPVSLGTPLEYSQPGGLLSTLEQSYGLVPGSTPQIDIGSQYSELWSGAMQAAFVQTTDWQLSWPEYTVLRDPMHVFGVGNVVPVTTEQVVAAEGPTFTQLIDWIDSKLTMKAIRRLNYLVVERNEQPSDVATAFLARNGLVPLGQ